MSTFILRWFGKRLAVVLAVATIVLLGVNPESFQAALFPLVMTMLGLAGLFLSLLIWQSIGDNGGQVDEICGEAAIVPVLIGLAMLCRVAGGDRIFWSIGWAEVCAVATAMLGFCLTHAEARRREEARVQ